MQYVMVPVPEELAKEVQGEVFKMILLKASQGWDLDLIRTLLDECEPGWRELLVQLLKDFLLKQLSSPGDLAATLGIDRQEVEDRYEGIVAYCEARELPLLIWTTPPRIGEYARTIELMFLPKDVADLLEVAFGSD